MKRVVTSGVAAVLLLVGGTAMVHAEGTGSRAGNTGMQSNETRSAATGVRESAPSRAGSINHESRTAPGVNSESPISGQANTVDSQRRVRDRAARDQAAERGDARARYSENGDSEMNRNLTAFSQSEDSARVETTRRIRSQLTANESLSTAAHNIKVITDDDGRVYLRGVVPSESEREQIREIARNVAGDGQVYDQLRVGTSRG